MTQVVFCKLVAIFLLQVFCSGARFHLVIVELSRGKFYQLHVPVWKIFCKPPLGIFEVHGIDFIPKVFTWQNCLIIKSVSGGDLLLMASLNSLFIMPSCVREVSYMNNGKTIQTIIWITRDITEQCWWHLLTACSSDLHGWPSTYPAHTCFPYYPI